MREEHGEHHGYGRRRWRRGHHGYGEFPRYFLTREEKIKKLEKYAQELRNELASDQEHIKELKPNSEGVRQ
jgi:ribosomal protein L44E